MTKAHPYNYVETDLQFTPVSDSVLTDSNTGKPRKKRKGNNKRSTNKKNGGVHGNSMQAQVARAENAAKGKHRALVNDLLAYNGTDTDILKLQRIAERSPTWEPNPRQQRMIRNRIKRERLLGIDERKPIVEPTAQNPLPPLDSAEQRAISVRDYCLNYTGSNWRIVRIRTKFLANPDYQPTWKEAKDIRRAKARAT